MSSIYNFQRKNRLPSISKKPIEIELIQDYAKAKQNDIAEVGSDQFMLFCKLGHTNGVQQNGKVRCGCVLDKKNFNVKKD